MSSQTLRKIFSTAVSLPLLAATPYYAYTAVDEGIYGAEIKQRTDMKRLVALDKQSLEGHKTRVQSLYAERARLNEAYEDAFVEAIQSGKSRTAANLSVRPIADELNALDLKLFSTDMSFIDSVFSNTTVSEADLETLIADYKSLRPSTYIMPEQAEYITECQVKYNLDSVFHEFSKSDRDKIRICTKTSAGPALQDIFEFGAGLLGLIGGGFLYLGMFSASNAGFRRVEEGLKKGRLKKPKLKKPDH